MKLEPIWKPFTTLKEVPHKGTFLANFDSSLGLQTTFVHGSSLYDYEDQGMPIDYCKLPEDNEFFATFVSETFSATGYVLGIGWDGLIGTLPTKEFTSDISLRSLLSQVSISLSVDDMTGTGNFQRQLGGLMRIKTTTTVAIQNHLFTNVSESIEFVGELTERQKESLRSLL